jgi:nucleotide-binding universal stress UspA family protein
MAKDILSQALSCFDSDVYNISAHHAIGDAAHAILDVCEELECDAIIMSTHGNKAIKRFLLGSVTDKVVHHAKVTVVIVR